MLEAATLHRTSPYSPALSPRAPVWDASRPLLSDEGVCNAVVGRRGGADRACLRLLEKAVSGHRRPRRGAGQRGAVARGAAMSSSKSPGLLLLAWICSCTLREPTNALREEVLHSMSPTKREWIADGPLVCRGRLPPSRHRLWRHELGLTRTRPLPAGTLHDISDDICSIVTTDTFIFQTNGELAIYGPRLQGLIAANSVARAVGGLQSPVFVCRGKSDCPAGAEETEELWYTQHTNQGRPFAEAACATLCSHEYVEIEGGPTADGGDIEQVFLHGRRRQLSQLCWLGLDAGVLDSASTFCPDE